MKFNYTLSLIMKLGHRNAANIRHKYATYKKALSEGLKKAWKIAKLSQEWNRITEESEVINEDIQQNWAHQCLGNVEGEAFVAQI